MADDLIDISQPVRDGIPVWPGDTPFSIEETWTIDEQCPVRVSRITMSTHTGTHADAHSHYSVDGVDTAGRELSPYIGHCVVVEVNGVDETVQPDEVLPSLDALGQAPERVLLRTFAEFPHDTWPKPFRAISAQLIEALAERGCVLIGTDAPSIDPETSKSLEAHHSVHKHGMAILEGLVLNHVEPGEYELIALPLRIEKADASPVRAILRRLGL